MWPKTRRYNAGFRYGPKVLVLSDTIRDGLRLLALWRRLLPPIDKPLNFGVPQTCLSVLHRSCPKGSITEQAAERRDGNTKPFGRLTASEDFVSRIGGIGRCQLTPPSAPGYGSGPRCGIAVGLSSPDTFHAGRSAAEKQAAIQPANRSLTVAALVQEYALPRSRDREGADGRTLECNCETEH